MEILHRAGANINCIGRAHLFNCNRCLCKQVVLHTLFFLLSSSDKIFLLLTATSASGCWHHSRCPCRSQFWSDGLCSSCPLLLLRTCKAEQTRVFSVVPCASGFVYRGRRGPVRELQLHLVLFYECQGDCTFCSGATVGSA